MDKWKHKRIGSLHPVKQTKKAKLKNGFQEERRIQILHTPEYRSDYKLLIEEFFHKVKNEIIASMPGNCFAYNRKKKRMLEVYRKPNLKGIKYMKLGLGRNRYYV